MATRGITLTGLALVPLLANWPVVIGWLNVDPIFGLSGIGTHLLPGPLPGLINLDPNAGITTEALGHYAAQEWLAGRIPWWNPFGGIGLPLAAEGQNQALFFPFVLLLALRNGPLLLLLTLQEVAAFSTYTLLRQLGLGVLASWIGGALFAVNGTFAWFGHGPMMPIAFLPLILVGVEREWAAAQRDATARCDTGWPVAAIAIALSLYAGFPETAYLDALLAVAWTLVRLACCEPSRRLALAIRSCLGAVSGVLVAAPFIVAFAHMLSVSDIGIHATDVAAMGAPAEAMPLLPLPYVFGPLTFGAGEGGPILWLWDFVGGYLSLPVVTMAIAAVLAPRGRRHRALRWMLAAWIALAVGVSFGVPGITRVVYAIPGISHIQVSRYAPPSWQLAGIVLAAIAVDDWRRGVGSAQHTVLALAISVVAAGAAIATGHPAIAFLSARVPHYLPWLVVSLLWAGFGTATVAILLAFRTTRLRRGLLASLLVCDGIMLFCVPRLAGLHQPSLDVAGVEFLQKNFGFNRTYSLGILAPNYPAYFRIASINQDYLPTPKLWADYVGTVLDPLSDRNAFTGAFQWPGQPRPDHIAEFLRRIPAFEALGVRYVLLPSTESLAPVFRRSIGQNLKATVLKPNGRFDVTASMELPTGDIDMISILIGTYSGAANGTLAVTACSGSLCQQGAADLATAPDNRPLVLHLDRPLAVSSATPVHLHFDHVGGTESVAIWEADGMADLAFGYTVLGLSARKVFDDRVMAIYELPNPAPYFTTQEGTCRIVLISRDAARTECATPERLVRRELFFPGWRVTVNGAPAEITQAAQIFQAVDLPSGVSTILFTYKPPYTFATSIVFFGGWFVILGGLVYSWVRVRHLRTSAH